MKRVLDDALERLRHTGPEEADGAPNHGPMAAEALAALGYDDEVPQWVDSYRRQLGPMPESILPLTPQTWRDALGLRRRVGDWVVFFRLQLRMAPWQTVLTAWLPRLIPGAMAHGTHGLIRTAHAVRALEDAETPLRVEELAAALGYWAAYYQALPGVPHLTGTYTIDQALDQLPRLGRDYDWRVTPPEFVRELDTHPDFPRAIDALTAPETIAAALGTLTEAGARLYLANASRYPLIFLYAVTGPVALRRLLPHLSTAMQHTAFAYVWQAVAVWTAAFGSSAPIAAWSDDVPPAAASEIVTQAVDTRDPHAIKFAEACLQEYRLNPQPVYLRAVLDWPPGCACRCASAALGGWWRASRCAGIPPYSPRATTASSLAAKERRDATPGKEPWTDRYDSGDPSPSDPSSDQTQHTAARSHTGLRGCGEPDGACSGGDRGTATSGCTGAAGLESLAAAGVGLVLVPLILLLGLREPSLGTYGIRAAHA